MGIARCRRRSWLRHPSRQQHGRYEVVVTDAVSQQRISLVFPPFGARLSAFIEDCYSVGIYLRLTRGLASPNEQHALFLQGRQPLDVVNEARAAVRMLPITEEQNQIMVTHADWFDSMHVFGLAGDCDPSKEGDMAPFDPDWNTLDNKWKTVLQIAQNHKLAEGAQWTSVKRDYPHVYPVKLPSNPTDETK